MKIFIKSVLIFTVILMVTPLLYAQMDLPRVSPQATVSQTIGISTVTVDYHRPGVKERVIWGGLVPYNEIWRTGANKATSVEFDSWVMIEGQKLEKGKYSIFTIPGETEWTVIFNKNTELWGTMGYKQEEDALRIQVKPQTAEFTERMMFYFENLTDNSANLVLQWEKLKVPVGIKVDVDALVLTAAEEAINWRTSYQAADYVLEHDLDLAKGEKWLSISQMIEKNYWNTTLKAQYLEKQGKQKDAVKTMEEALKMGEALERTPFNLEEMKKLLNDWKQK